jgi:C-terminal processing protease CtpA/Prc
MTHPGPTVLLCAAALAGLALPVRGQGEQARADLEWGFEADEVGASPRDWHPPAPHTTTRVAEADAAAGDRWLRVETAGGAEAGVLVLSRPAAPYRGKVVKLAAALRALAPEASAQLWLRVDRAGAKRGFFDNMADRPVGGRDWQRVEIVGDVDADASALAFGVIVRGAVGIDDVVLQVEGDAIVTPVEPPRPLSARGLANLLAFARLYGYVRFFHPTDAAAAADWDRFAVEGVRRVESAASPEALVAELRALVAPLAPTVSLGVVGPVDPLLPALEAPEDLERAEVLAWEHDGVQLGKGAAGVYRSFRRKRSWRAATELGLAPPDQPMLIDCTPEVRVSLPLTLWPELARAAPKDAAAAPSPKPRYTGDDRAVRLAAVVQLWSVPQHFYPYFDVVQSDWHGALERALTRAATDKDALAFLATLRRLVAELRDGHGHVTHPGDDAVARLPLDWTWAGPDLVVTRVDGTFAADDGAELARGDVVRAIGGQPVPALAAAAELEISAATPQYMRWRTSRDLLRGKLGEQVTLEVEGGDGRHRTFALPRAMGPPVEEERPAAIHAVREGIVYVDVGRGDDAALERALPQLVAAQGVVFDFRGYPSKLNPNRLFEHLIREPVQSAQWLVPKVRWPDRAGMTFTTPPRWAIGPADPHVTGRLAFITDGRTLSYAESCMGIVEHYKLGAIVGEATAGTNGNVNPFSVVGGYWVGWTGMKVLKHDGTRHHGVGILPTIPVSRTVAGIRDGRDELLEAAVAAVDS